MGKRLESLNQSLIEFINEQKMFFVGTAVSSGRVNVSPKGMDTFRVLDDNTVLWLNLTGSGNETAAHILENDRMTIMFCAFEGKPLILRLYGHARAFHARDQFFQKHIDKFPKIAGTRQIFEMKIDLVQTSCGMAVPLYDYADQRTELKSWAEKQGDDGLEDYQRRKNMVSLDGMETGIF